MTTKALIAGELIIAVDFDGTISTDPNMAKFDDLVMQPECKRVLTRLYESGARLMLWTCRTGPVLDQAIEFLDNEGILYVFETINEQVKEVIEKYSPNVSRKVGADVYIDDKNVGSTIDWCNIEIAIFGDCLGDHRGVPDNWQD